MQEIPSIVERLWAAAERHAAEDSVAASLEIGGKVFESADEVLQHRRSLTPATRRNMFDKLIRMKASQVLQLQPA